jgi:ribosomal protein S18 acetylase RimI-like enzyme
VRLLATAVDRAAAIGTLYLCLEVNQRNARAQRFYNKNGFTTAGTKTFVVGAHTEHDFMMVRPL